jgi:hypothetical protein
MPKSKLPIKIVATLMLSLLLFGCGTTYNGVTLNETRLKQTKRIVVLALAGDSITYQKQGVIKGEFRSFNVPSWGLDDFYAERFANEMTATLGVEAIVYRGAMYETLRKRLYSENPLLRRDRFDWKASEQDLRTVAIETNSDLIALVLREGFNDELAMTQSLVAGFGYTSGRGMCSAFANLTIMIVDAVRIEPIAGANVFKVGSDGKILSGRRGLPSALCKNEAADLSAEQMEVLRRTLQTIVDPATIQQTTKRLLKYDVR